MAGQTNYMLLRIPKVKNIWNLDTWSMGYGGGGGAHGLHSIASLYVYISFLFFI